MGLDGIKVYLINKPKLKSMTKKVTLSLLAIVFATVASIQSCKKDDKPADKTTPTEFIADSTSFANFSTWSLDKTNFGPSPSLDVAHAGNDSTVTRKVYFKNGQARVNGAYPVGTICVKHSTNPAGTVNEIVGMVKRGNGFNPTTGDWEWFMLDANGKIAKDMSGMEMRGGASMMNGMCNGCHGKASSKDFTFSK